MPLNEEDSPQARRIVMRRGRSGFGQGTSTQSESLNLRGTDTIDDDVDDAVDPEAVHDRIVSAARTRPRTAPPAAAAAAFSDGSEGPADPRARMNQVAQAGSASYSKEYRQTMLHRLLLRRVPLDQIASAMGVSISTLEKDRVELKSRLRDVARSLDINEIVGNQTEMYNELAGMSLRIATNDTTPTAMKLAAMRTTLAAEADRTRFLNTAGVFDVLRFRKSEDGTDVSDIQQLMNNTNDMFERLMNEPDPVAAPRPQARARRPVRPAGFAKMSMDDNDASTSATEEVEL